MRAHGFENDTTRFLLVLFTSMLASCATVDTGIKPSFEWDETHVSPGTSLVIEETGRMSLPSPTGTLITYVIKASGFSSEEALSLWSQREGRYLELPFTLSTSGVVRVHGNDSLAAGGFVPGQALDLALVSKTSNKRAQAKVTPFPIQAQGVGGCSASAEVVSGKGLLFLMTFKGFEPGEEVQITSDYKNEKLVRPQKATDKGEIKMPVLFGPGDRGKATAMATGKKCTVSLDYNVGKDAIVLQ